MQSSGLSQPASHALEQLKKFPWIRRFYLAGGSGLAIQLQHRLSFDLDFFSNKVFDEKMIDSDLRKTGQYHLDRLARDTLLGELSQTKISFFTLKEKLISPPTSFNKITVACIPDIAAMKLEAIGSRGSKKDFVDLFWISKTHPLDQCLDFYQTRYPSGKDNLFHIIKSLTYFEDAENSVDITPIKPTNWIIVKKFFESEAVRLGKKYL